MHDFIEPLSHGIFAIDTGFVRPRLDAAYLIVEQGRAAYVDAGVNDSVPRLLAALEAQGLSRDAVDWVIPTHVHLDHAGGAGLLMEALPKARMVVHPLGARHMADPGALLDGARAVYGAEEVARTYGDVRPVAAERMATSTDGMTIELAGRPLLFIDSPGHARHHHCIWDAASRGWFTGDTFGISYPEFEAPAGRYLMPTTTPVHFEPEALRRSVHRMLEREPVWMYPTHYSRVGGSVEEVRRLSTLLLDQAEVMAALARSLADAPARHDAIKAALRTLFTERLRAQGSALDDAAMGDLLAMDIELDAQGLAVWLDRDVRKARPRT